ncbi:MAG TPA: hypothetical protein ENL07_05905 [Chlorobaculum parvum]|uniref:Uncharacterized protein n=1 Tax=Chlorobaculum parvum TaxID=274539 RepID=A0A7C5HMV3_9CHLB|nr:hypothetical protein [Chlorobaculum parvum]
MPQHACDRLELCRVGEQVVFDKLVA